MEFGGGDFLNLEKSNFNRKVMHQLKLDNGRITSDPKTILSEQRRFYPSLYQSDPNVEFKIITGIKVTEEDNHLLCTDITLEELTTANNGMAKNKSRGYDGFTVEFYLKFWAILGPVYLQVIKESLKEKMLHLSAWRGIITLIPKKGVNY